MQKRSLEVAERDRPVDGETLDLVERRRVCRIRRVAAVATAERDHVGGRGVRLHVADLSRRRVRAEDDVLADGERVERRPARVALRGVERVEAVVDALDLRAVEDLVAETEERVLDLAAHLREEVEMPARKLGPGQGYVDDVLGQCAIEVCALELRLARLEGGFEPLACRVQRHAALAVANAAQRLLQLALAA